MNNITEILTDLGFEKKEIIVYLALMKLGDSTALKISREAAIDRTTTYDVLERLMNKGIVSVYLRNNAKTYACLEPKKLLHHFKEKYSSLETILPELTKLNEQGNPSAKSSIFYGKEGLRSVGKSMVHTMLEKNIKQYHVINLKREFEEIFGFLSNQAVMKLDSLKVKDFGLVGKGAKFTKSKNGSYKYLEMKLLSPVTTLIYEHQVVFFVWSSPYFAIHIESQDIAKAQMEYFNLLWGN